MKKIISVLLSAVMLLSVTAGLDLTAFASTYSGTCGDDVTWSLDTETGELVLSGSGAMTDYTSSSSIPWVEEDYESYITSVTILSGVTTIAFCSFSNCSNLRSVTISDSVISIDSTAFGNCRSLISIDVDGNNTYYSSQDGALFNKDKTELIQYPIGKTDTSYEIPDGVTSIGDYAFRYCSNLTSITIPDSVTSIGNDAFYTCTSLASITIPDSVTSIGAGVFGDCTGLTSVTIGNSVESISSSAFPGCTSLTSITIPDNVTSIGNDAFAHCTSLSSITIGDGVTSIDIEAFYDTAYYNDSSK